MIKYIVGCIACIVLALGMYINAQVPPSFERNFGKYLIDSTPDEFGRVETVFSICVDRNLTFRQNIQNIFYPNPLTPSVCSSSRGGLFWDVFRRLGVALLFMFFIRAGARLVVSGSDDEKRKKALSSMLYILYGGFLFLGSTRILGDVLNIGGLQGSQELADRLENNLFLQILTLLKGFAFFGAIVLLVFYGYRMMAATDQEDKLKSAKIGIRNIIIALVAIKIIDYIYYIATVPSFGTDAANLILQIATVLGYIVGALLMLSVFYLGFLLLTGRGEEDTVTKAKNIITTIILSSLVIFLFLLIVYQVMQEIG